MPVTRSKSDATAAASAGGDTTAAAAAGSDTTATAAAGSNVAAAVAASSDLDDSTLNSADSMANVGALAAAIHNLGNAKYFDGMNQLHLNARSAHDKNDIVKTFLAVRAMREHMNERRLAEDIVGRSLVPLFLALLPKESTSEAFSAALDIKHSDLTDMNLSTFETKLLAYLAKTVHPDTSGSCMWMQLVTLALRGCGLPVMHASLAVNTGNAVHFLGLAMTRTT